MSPQKLCRQCGRTQPPAEFHKDRSKPDGRRSTCRECDRERQRAARAGEAFKERKAKEAAAYYARNRAECIARAQSFHAANPHVQWAATYRKRAREYGLDPVVEPFTIGDVLAAYGDACHYCGGSFEELDHYLPVCAGGAHVLANVRPSCRICNNRKAQSERKIA